MINQNEFTYIEHDDSDNRRIRDQTDEIETVITAWLLTMQTVKVNQTGVRMDRQKKFQFLLTENMRREIL